VMADAQAQFIANGNQSMQTKLPSHGLHVGRSS
jgi:hypothetical protein